MKRWILVGVLAVFLCGCKAADTMETVKDVWAEPEKPAPREVSVKLPGEAAVPAAESENGRMYLCRDYEIYIQTLNAGDLDATVRSVSGYGSEDLQVIATSPDGVDRYDFVWASAGENGDRLGRGVILDDGSYHYVLSVLRDADTAKTSQVVWSEVFDSFMLNTD